MPEHGTTDACGPECDVLLGNRGGERQHLVAIEFAADYDRRRAYKAAGYAGNAWKQNASEILTRPDVARCVLVHSGPRDQEAQDWGEELRGLERVRARARPSDLFTLGEPDPALWESFLVMLHRGIEDRSSTDPSEEILLESSSKMPAVIAYYPAGRRQATLRMLAKSAAAALNNFQVLPTAEWPEWARIACEGWHETKTNKMLPIFNPGAASTRSAKLEGLIVERHAVTYEQRQADAEKIGADYIAAIEAEVAALIEDLRQDLVEDDEDGSGSAVAGGAQIESEGVSGAIEALAGFAGRVCGRLG